jgi:hypothetical protein
MSALPTRKQCAGLTPAWLRADLKRRVRKHIGDAQRHMQTLRHNRDKLTGQAWLNANLRVIRAGVAISMVARRLIALR